MALWVDPFAKEREEGMQTRRPAKDWRGHTARPLDYFVFQIPALAQAGFRVLALDMKGYGDSSSPPGELTIP